MKSKIILITICYSLLFACKPKKKIITSADDKKTPAVSKTVGKVSHQYKATGCSTVILIESSVLDAPRVLIPKDKLPAPFDVDGLEISFNYRTLRMPNPPGCTIGIPVGISDISKK